jgi:hypothetical protein
MSKDSSPSGWHLRYGWPPWADLSRRLGQDLLMTQASGGNTSVKLDDRRFLVKASGLRLGEVTTDKGWVLADYQAIRKGVPDLDKQKGVESQVQRLSNVTDFFPVNPRSQNISGSRSSRPVAKSLGGPRAQHRRPTFGAHAGRRSAGLLFQPVGRRPEILLDSPRCSRPRTLFQGGGKSAQRAPRPNREPLDSSKPWDRLGERFRQENSGRRRRFRGTPEKTFRHAPIPTAGH